LVSYEYIVSLKKNWKVPFLLIFIIVKKQCVIHDFLASKFFLVIFSIGLGVIEQIVMFWHHMEINMEMHFFQKEKSPLQAIGNLKN
jgi:hypothetical protein